MRVWTDIGRKYITQWLLDNHTDAADLLKDDVYINEYINSIVTDDMGFMFISMYDFSSKDGIGKTLLVSENFITYSEDLTPVVEKTKWKEDEIKPELKKIRVCDW